MIFQPNSHDLTLSPWGPYSQKYAGISHVADPDQGVRFDLSVFPGLYRRKVEVPNVMVEGNYHIWEASPDLSYFSTRHEIEEKDRVYCDISYGKLEEDAYLIRAHCVNHSHDVQNLVLHYMASIQFPTVKNDWVSQEVPPVQWTLPENCLYCRAVDYLRFSRETTLPTDSLVPDGKRPNEVRGRGFSGGSAVLLQAGNGEKMDFLLDVPHSFSQPVMAVRYQSSSPCVLAAEGDGFLAEGTLPPTEQPGIAFLSVSQYRRGEKLSFSLWAKEGSLVVDSLTLCEKQNAPSLNCQLPQEPHVPQVWELGSDTPLDQNTTMLPLFKDAAKDPDTSHNTLILKYPAAQGYYGLYWDFPDYCLRYWLTDELDYSLRYLAHDHVRKVLSGNDLGHFSNVFLRPIPVKPQESLSVYGVVCRGSSREEVEQKLSQLIVKRANFPQMWEDQRAAALEAGGNPQGEPYRFPKTG